MRSVLAAFGIALALGTAAPALAATVLLTGATTTSNNNLLYSSGTGVETVKFSAVGLTYVTATPQVSKALKYTEGLGVQPSGDTRHTVDNSGGYDFILLRFDTAVALTGAKFANSNWYNDSKADTDASISFATFDYSAFGQTYKTELTGAAKTSFFNTLATGLSANMFASNSIGWGTETRSFNDGPQPNVSNVWLVGASISNLDRKVDSFKLQSITFSVPTAVPEPSTWAMLILGMGVIGGAMRRRSRRELALA